MARRVLDTNVLIRHWLRSSKAKTPRQISLGLARKWGQALTQLEQTNAILTPIYIEYVCGQGSAHEVNLARAFLEPFEIVDGGNILSQDWAYARRVAERVPRDGLRRQLGDCLIRAICERLHWELRTYERRFPHRAP